MAPYGRELGMCWEVCWANQAAERCVGKLTDCFDPNALRQLNLPDAENERVPGKRSYQNPVIWGKAIYARPNSR